MTWMMLERMFITTHFLKCWETGLLEITSRSVIIFLILTHPENLSRVVMCDPPREKRDKGDSTGMGAMAWVVKFFEYCLVR